MIRSITVSLVLALLAAGCVAGAPPEARLGAARPAPTFYADDPACRVKSIEKLPTVFEGMVKSPIADLYAVSKPDKNEIYQIYTMKADGSDERCLTCTDLPGGPRADRNKMMITWHPSGQWLTVGIEENTHENSWMFKSWQLGLLQSGIWLNMWMTTPDGSRWYQMTDYKKSKEAPSDGFVGTPFTPDGKKAVWAEIIDGNIFANHFGKWRLFMADVGTGADGGPVLVNKKDITPAGARWVEPGNFSPDGRHLLLSADIDLVDAEGQDQWTLDITTGELRRLTSSPYVWDEHGIFSNDGRKISFMSSYPYRTEPDTYKITGLKNEFMLMDADGSHLQQLTHFNTPGYPESQKDRTIAAVAAFFPEDGSRMFANVMGPDFSKVNWLITFEGNCGGR